MPVRGCLAALAMQDGIARLGDPDLQIRVGVHTGEVVVQTIEHGIYRTYDAAGANVHLAKLAWSKWQMQAASWSRRRPTLRPSNSLKSNRLACKLFVGSPHLLRFSRSRGLQHAPSSGVFRSGITVKPAAPAETMNSPLCCKNSKIRSRAKVVW